MKIKNETQLIMRLFQSKYAMTEFNYIEGQTTDEYMESHPFIQAGKKYFENPYLIGMLIDDNKQDEIEFIFKGIKDSKPNFPILELLIGCDKKFVKKYIKDYMVKFMESLEEEYKSTTIDELIYTAIQNKNTQSYLDIIEYAKTHNIPPAYNSYANAKHGSAFYYACNYDDTTLAYQMLEDGADPKENDSLAFAIACKKGYYKLAWDMVEKYNVNYKTKHNLGKAMIERNETKGIPIKEEDLEYKDKLLSLYEEPASSSETGTLEIDNIATETSTN